MDKKELKDKKNNKLEELRGTKNIPNIKSTKKRILIPKIQNMGGEIINHIKKRNR